MNTAIVGGRVFPPTNSEGMSTGDDRSNLFIGLSALHTIFVRLHNRWRENSLNKILESRLISKI